MEVDQQHAACLGQGRIGLNRALDIGGRVGCDGKRAGVNWRPNESIDQLRDRVEVRRPITAEQARDGAAVDVAASRELFL